MADETQMRVVPPTLPAGFCLSSANIIGLFNQLEVYLPGNFAVFNVGPDEPTIENRDKLWIKTDSTTGIPIGIYGWAPTLGIWASPHWNKGILPSNELRMFIGDASAVDTYDGGEPGMVSVSTGPFWEISTDYSDRVPIGVGMTVTTVDTDKLVFDSAAQAVPNFRSVYFIQPTGRLYDRA